MSSTINYSENFCEAINIVTNSIIQGLSFDKTILCTIISIDKAQKGEYLVSDGSSTFTAVSSNKTYKVNTQVYVLIPNGDYTQQKLIVSEYVSGTENEKEDYSFPFETIVPGETIEIEEKNIGLIANKKQKKNNGYGIKIIDSANSKYQFNKEIIYTRLGVQASFKTFFEELIENSNKTTSRKEVYIEYGDYSIVITLSGTDKDGKAIKDKRYLFNCSDFFGNPYRLDAYTEQSIVFNISEFKKITSIDVQFQESGNFYSINDQTGEKKFFKTTQDKNKVDEINLYVTDLKFIFGFDINEYETNDLLINNLEELNYKNNQKKNLQLNWIRKRTDQSSLISLYRKGMLKSYCKDLWYLWNFSENSGSNDLEKKILKYKSTDDISFYWYKYLIKSGVSDKILDEELWTLAAYRNNLNYQNSDFDEKIYGKKYLDQIKTVAENPFKFDFRTSVEHNREKIKMAIVFNGCLRKKTLTLTEGIHIDDGTGDGALEKEVIILKKVEPPFYLSSDDWNKKLKNEFKSGDNVEDNSSIKLVGENACIIKDGTQYNKYIYPYENEVYYTPDVTVDIEDIFNNKDELDAEFQNKNKDGKIIKVVYLDKNNKYIDTKISLKDTDKEFILLDWVRQYNKEQIEVEKTEDEKHLIANENPKYTISTTPEFLSAEEFKKKTDTEKEEVKDSNNEPHDVYRNFELVPIKVFKSNEIIYTNTTDSAIYNTTNLVENIELNCIDQLKGNYFIYGFDDHVGQDTASCANRKIQVKFDSVNSEDVDSENIKMAWRIPKELSMITTPEKFTIEDTEKYSSVLSDKETVKWIDGDIIAEAMATAKTEYANYWIDSKQSTYKGYWISSQIEVKNSASGKEDSTKEYNFSIPYAINDLYRAAWANNTISCFVWKKIKGANDNQVTVNKGEKTLNFGHLGTNGTKYSFNIRFGCPYNLTFNSNGTYKSSEKKSDLIQPFLDDNVENVGVEIIPTLHTGSEALTIDPKKIEWSWHVDPYFKEKRNVKIGGKEQEKTITYKTVIIHNPTEKCFIRTCRTNNYEEGLTSTDPSVDTKNKDLKTSLNFHSKNHCAILKATIEYKSKKLDAYLPIPMRFDTAVGVYSGADKVIYNSLGTEPYYHDTEHMLYSKKNEPFEDSRFEVYIDREKSSTPIDKNYYPYFETGSILTYNQKNYRLYVQPHIFDTIYGYNSSHNKDDDDGSGKLLRFNTDLTPKTGKDAEAVVYECKSNGNTLTWYTEATKKEDEKRTGYLYTYDTNILKVPRMFYSENAKTPVSIIGFRAGTIKWGGHEYILYRNNNSNYEFDEFDGFYGYNENKIDKEKSKGTLLKFKLEDLSYSGTVSIYNVTLPTESNSYQLTGYTKENSTNSKYKIDATKKGRTTCFVQPIFIAQNRFGNTIVNEWDGKLQINEEDNYILSMMMGAGIKEKTDNSFSGVLMGEVQRSNTRTIGLFGYDHGEESFGFKRDGTAFIGKSGTGRIEFNGKEGIITSSNYSVNKKGASLNLATGDFNLKSFGEGEVQISGIGSQKNPFLKIVEAADAVTYKQNITINNIKYEGYTFRLYKTANSEYIYGYSSSFSDEYKKTLDEKTKKEREKQIALIRFTKKEKDGIITLKLDSSPIAWIKNAEVLNNHSYLKWITTGDKEEERIGELFSLGDSKKVTIFEARRGTYYLQSSKYPQGVGLYINLEDGQLISKNNGGTITIDPAEEDALFNIKNSQGESLINIGNENYYLKSGNYNSDSLNGMYIRLDTGSISSKSNLGTVMLNPDSSSSLFYIKDNIGTVLMNVGSSSYYLQSSGYKSDDSGKGMRFNLSSGDFTSKGPGGTVIIKPSQSDQLFRISNADGLIYMTIGSNTQYIKTAKYKQFQKGIKINLNSGGFSICSGLDELTSGSAGIILSNNSSNYFQVKKNYLKDKTENIFLKDTDGTSGVFDLFFNPWGDSIILRDVSTNKFYKAQFVTNSHTSAPWVPKDIPCFMHIVNTFNMKNQKDEDVPGNIYAIFGDYILTDFTRFIKLGVTITSANEITMTGNYSYDKNNKIIKKANEIPGSGNDKTKYTLEYRLGKLYFPKYQNSITTDTTKKTHINSIAHHVPTNYFYHTLEYSKGTIQRYQYNKKAEKWIYDNNSDKKITLKGTDKKTISNVWEIAIDENYFYAITRNASDSDSPNEGFLYKYDLTKIKDTDTSWIADARYTMSYYSKNDYACQGLEVKGDYLYLCYTPDQWKDQIVHVRKINANGTTSKKINVNFSDLDPRTELEEIAFKIVDDTGKKDNKIAYISLAFPKELGRLVKIYTFNNFNVTSKEGETVTLSFKNDGSIKYIFLNPNKIVNGAEVKVPQGFTYGYDKFTEEGFFINGFICKKDGVDNGGTLVLNYLSDLPSNTTSLSLQATKLIDISGSNFILKSGNYQTASDGSPIHNHGLQSSQGTFFDLNNGKLITRNADITGKITATSGQIGGWKIQNGFIDSEASVNGETSRMYIASNLNSATKYIDASYNGKTIFSVDREGKLYARNADIGGVITATSGSFKNCIIEDTCTIGKWKVGSHCLYYGSTAKFGPKHAFLYPSGKNITGPGTGEEKKYWIFGAGANFGVTIAGELYATAGQIGGWTINSDFIKRGNITLGNNVISALIDKWNKLGVGVKMQSNGTIAFQFKDDLSNEQEHSYIGQVGNDKKGITGITFSLGSYYKEEDRNRHTIFNDGTYGHQFWGTVYFKDAYYGGSSSSTNSDLRLKNSIQNLSSNYEILFSYLKPIIYKYNDGTSNRYHSGFIAQDVLTAIQESDLTTQDFAALTIQPVKNNEFNGLSDIYSLRYEEFIALNTHMIQKCLKRIDELENEIKTLKAQL